MSKELTPLEELQFIRHYEINDDHITLNHHIICKRSLDNIETALKDYERLLSLRKTAEWADEKLRTKKKLKVLEIIKEKGCSYIEIVLIVSHHNYEEYCIEMNSGRVYSSRYECERAFKTQEEFNLLREVLL